MTVIVNKNICRAIRQRIESFPTKSYGIIEEKVKDFENQIQAFSHANNEQGRLPQFDKIVSYAYRIYCLSGLSIENLFVSSFAAAHFWSNKDWIDPYKYTNNSGLAEIMTAICQEDFKAENFIMLSYLQDNGTDNLANFYNWARIIHARLTYDRQSLEIEMFPTEEKIYVSLESVVDNEYFYKDPITNTIYKLTFKGESLTSVSVTYFDEGVGNEYIYKEGTLISENTCEVNFEVRVSRLWKSLSELKAEAGEISNYLQDNGVNYFYHFTSIENLESIKEYGGLFSWHFLNENHIDIPLQGGDNLSRIIDKRYSRQDYVRLSFCSSLPMAKAVWERNNNAQLVLLKISTEVATLRETLFCDRNATIKTSKCGSKLDDLKKVDLSATKLKKCPREEDDETFARRQAEILCRTFVPIKYILNIDNPEIMNFNN